MKKSYSMINAIAIFLVLALAIFLFIGLKHRDRTRELSDYGNVRIEVDSEKRIVHYFDGDNTLSTKELGSLLQLSKNYEVIYYKPVSTHFRTP